MRSFATILLALSLPLYVFGAHGNPRRHTGLAHRARGDVLDKRDFSARLTFYDIEVGITACGGRYSPNDHVVALNDEMFGSGYPGPNCGKTIILTANGKTTTAIVVDMCPGCPYGGLDLTRGLFGFYADLGKGVIQGSWKFAGDSPEPTKPDPTTSKPKPKPTPTPTPEDPPPSPLPSPKHASTSEPPPPPPPSTSSTRTSSKKPPPTSTSSSTTSSTSSSTTTSQHTSSTPNPSPGLNPSGLAQPGGVIPSNGDDTQNLEELNEAIINLGGLVEACN